MADEGIDAERNLERANGLRNRFVGEKDPASLIESSRLNLSKTDDAFYQNYLVRLRAPRNPRGLPRSNALLWRCFQYFLNQLGALDEIQEDGEALAKILSETTPRRLLFILITVEDELDASTVFETLNARGLKLATADLLKNYLFSKVRVQTDLDALQRRWQALIVTVTPERFSDFLRYHLLSEQTCVRKERLFKLIRDRIETSPQVFDLLSALENRAELFAALADSNHEYWMERPAAKPYIRELVLFRARQVTPVLFAAWERFSPDDFVRVLKLTSVVSFRCQVGGRNPNSLEPVYHEAAKAILAGTTASPVQYSRTCSPSMWTTGHSSAILRCIRSTPVGARNSSSTSCVGWRRTPAALHEIRRPNPRQSNTFFRRIDPATGRGRFPLWKRKRRLIDSGTLRCWNRPPTAISETHLTPRSPPYTDGAPMR